MSKLDEIRDAIQRKLNISPTYGLIGDSDGRIDFAGRPGYIWVRIPSASGGDYTETAVKAPTTGAVPMRAGMPVIIGYDHRGDMTILNADFDAQLGVGIDPRLNNAADQRIYGYVSQSMLLTFRCQPISTPSTDSMTVWAKGGWWIDGARTAHWFGGDTVSLTGHIPATGNHLLALVYVALADEDLKAVVSTAQPIGEALDPEVDAQECLDQLSVGDLPLWFWRLYGDQTRLTDGDSYMDARQLINSSIGGPAVGISQYNSNDLADLPGQELPSGYNIVLHGGITNSGNVTIAGHLKIV